MLPSMTWSCQSDKRAMAGVMSLSVDQTHLVVVIKFSQLKRLLQSPELSEMVIYITPRCLPRQRPESKNKVRVLFVLAG